MEIRRYRKADEPLLFDMLVDEAMSGAIITVQLVTIDTLKHLNRA